MTDHTPDDAIVDVEIYNSHPELGDCEEQHPHHGSHHNGFGTWPANFGWCIGGDNGDLTTETEYAIEPEPHDCARGHTNELVTAIEELPIYRDDARIITRTVTYGPWRYVTPEEIRHA